MQTVDFRDGVLRFQLPKKWTAEYLKDGGALFREPAGIGVLLLNTVEFEATPPVEPSHAVDLLANYAGHEGRDVMQLKNESALVTFVDSHEDLTAFVWEIAHALNPDTIRLAAFSYTVKSASVNEPEIVKTVSMLTREIALCQFGTNHQPAE